MHAYTHELIQRGGNTIAIQCSNNVQLWPDNIQGKCRDSETCEHSGKLWAWQDYVRIHVTGRDEGIVTDPTSLATSSDQSFDSFTKNVFMKQVIRTRMLPLQNPEHKSKTNIMKNLLPEMRTCSTCMHVHPCTHKHMHTLGQCLGLVLSSPRRLRRSWKYRHDHGWEWNHLT